jgi:hypothetical protein
MLTLCLLGNKEKGICPFPYFSEKGIPPCLVRISNE